MIKKLVLSSLGVYSLTSYYLFKNPQILHQKKIYKQPILNTLNDKPGDKMFLISHRGGSYEKVENTIEAFQNAIDHGSNLLEMDVQMTKDGVVVVCHDTNLSRLCGVDVNVSDLNYSELPKFARSIRLDHFNNVSFDTGEDCQAKIPTLEEVFQKFPNMLMQVDLKGGSREITKRVSELIKQYNREHLTNWGAMGDDQYLKQFNPDLERFFSPFAVMKVYGLYLTGLLSFFKVEDAFFSIPKYSTNYEKWKQSKGDTFSVKAFFTVFKFLENVSGPLIEHLQKRGVLVFHWVLNEETDFEDCMKFNVNGIMTDKPLLLKNFLKKHDKYIEN